MAIGKTLKELTGYVVGGALALGSGSGFLSWWMSDKQNANLPTSSKQAELVTGSVTQDKALREDLKDKYPKATEKELDVLAQYQTLELYRERCKPGRASANRVWCANVSEQSNHLNLDSAREQMAKLEPDYNNVVAKLEGRPPPTPPIAQTPSTPKDDEGTLEKLNEGAKRFVWNHGEIGSAVQGAGWGAALGALGYAAIRGRRWWKGEGKPQDVPASGAAAVDSAGKSGDGQTVLSMTKESKAQSVQLGRDFDEIMKAEAAQLKGGPTTALAAATVLGGAAVTYTPGEVQAKPVGSPGAAAPSACEIAFPDNMRAAEVCKVGAAAAVQENRANPTTKKPGSAPTL